MTQPSSINDISISSIYLHSRNSYFPLKKRWLNVVNIDSILIKHYLTLIKSTLLKINLCWYFQFRSQTLIMESNINKPGKL